MKTAVLACCAALAALAFPFPSGAGELIDSMGDPRVKNALEEEGLVYRINENGQFLLTFEMDEEDPEAGDEETRTHLVCVNSRTAELGALEIREVFCVAYEGAPLSKAQMSELLLENTDFILGSWEISPVDTDEGGHRSQIVRFTARIDADCSPEKLHTAVNAVAKTGDRLEAEWLGTDIW